MKRKIEIELENDGKTVLKTVEKFNEEEKKENFIGREWVVEEK